MYASIVQLRNVTETDLIMKLIAIWKHTENESISLRKHAYMPMVVGCRLDV